MKYLVKAANLHVFNQISEQITMSDVGEVYYYGKLLIMKPNAVVY